MTMSQYYQEPLCLEPLDCDPDKDGKKSDHRIVVTKPIADSTSKSTWFLFPTAIHYSYTVD